MITCEGLYKSLQKHGLTLFTGVPDSTFKEFLLFLDDNHGERLIHIPTANEGDAVALAAGHHLAEGKIAAAYMQNSGLGNSINPLTSLVDPKVYSIPVLLIIGWRGRPGEKDEPQHKKMGAITLEMLCTLGIPHALLPETDEELPPLWEKAFSHMKENHAPYAVIIPKKRLAPYQGNRKNKNSLEMNREEAIRTIVERLEGSEAIVSTTGKPSRELYEYRDRLGQGHEHDFYTVGSLGCSLSIALGIAITLPQKEVLVFDGDGSALMHLGSWSTIGCQQPSNLKHIIFDNESYESTGAQPSNSSNVDLPKVALACGYRFADQVQTKQDLTEKISSLLEQQGPGLLVVKVKNDSRADLGRPKTTPIENKAAFMGFLAESRKD